MSETWTFTFGYGQEMEPGPMARGAGVVGLPLRKRYVRITAESADACREVMWLLFNRRWAFAYPSEEEAGVGQFGLELLADITWHGPTSHVPIRVSEGSVLDERVREQEGLIAAVAEGRARLYAEGVDAPRGAVRPPLPADGDVDGEGGAEHDPGPQPAPQPTDGGA